MHKATDHTGQEGSDSAPDSREHWVETPNVTLEIEDRAPTYGGGKRKIHVEIGNVGEGALGENELLYARIDGVTVRLSEDPYIKHNNLTDRHEEFAGKSSDPVSKYDEQGNSFEEIHETFQRMNDSFDKLESELLILRWVVGGGFVLLSIQMAFWANYMT